MRILGLDPGSRYTGYGIIETTDDSRIVHIASGRINASKAGTFEQRLVVIYDGLQSVIEEFPVECASVETIFANKNVMSTIKLGQARGVALLAAAHADLVVNEYAPAKVKQIVVGNGRASKADVQEMVKRMLGIRGAISEDAADALAIAICHCHHFELDARLVTSVRT